MGVASQRGLAPCSTSPSHSLILVLGSLAWSGRWQPVGPLGHSATSDCVSCVDGVNMAGSKSQAKPSHHCATAQGDQKIQCTVPVQIASQTRTHKSLQHRGTPRPSLSSNCTVSRESVQDKRCTQGYILQFPVENTMPQRTLKQHSARVLATKGSHQVSTAPPDFHHC